MHVIFPLFTQNCLASQLQAYIELFARQEPLQQSNSTITLSILQNLNSYFSIYMKIDQQPDILQHNMDFRTAFGNQGKQKLINETLSMENITSFFPIVKCSQEFTICSEGLLSKSKAKRKMFCNCGGSRSGN